MAKQKKEEIVAADSNLPAELGESVLSFLDEKADEVYESGFVMFKIGHQTGTVAAAGRGADEELIGVILAVEKVRGLWFNGTEEERRNVESWLGKLPICSSRGNNGTKGELPKVLDRDTPQLIRAITEPIIAADFICGNGKDCPWNAFGSAGRGKLCKESRRFLIWVPASDIIGVLSIPPSSIRNWQNYRSGFEGKHFSRTVTRISFQVVGTQPNMYSVVHFTAVKGGLVAPGMIAPLGRKVLYGGKEMMEIEAVVAEFLSLPTEREIDYPDNGSRQSGSPAVAPESEDDF